MNGQWTMTEIEPTPEMNACWRNMTIEYQDRWKLEWIYDVKCQTNEKKGETLNFDMEMDESRENERWIEMKKVFGERTWMEIGRHLNEYEVK